MEFYIFTFLCLVVHFLIFLNCFIRCNSYIPHNQITWIVRALLSIIILYQVIRVISRIVFCKESFDKKSRNAVNSWKMIFRNNCSFDRRQWNILPGSFDRLYLQLLENPRMSTADKMLFEINRLSSFSLAGNTISISPLKLAKEGFYFSLDSNTSKCAFCGVEKGNWNANDDTTREHQRLNPNCPYVNDRAFARNIPMHDVNEYQQSTRILSTLGNVSGPPAVADHGYVAAFQQPHTLSQQLTTNQSPKFLDYVEIESRRRSFTGWPHLLPEHDILAKAGFFYTGREDHVRCAYCGIGLKHWEITDIPWFEHAYWSPECFYVKERKGNDYIRLVQSIDLRTTLDDQSPTSSLATEETANDFDKVKEINRRLKDQMKCIRCRNNDICMLFVNCGHRQTCEECSHQLQYCPTCGIKIKKMLKTFLS